MPLNTRYSVMRELKKMQKIYGNGRQMTIHLRKAFGSDRTFLYGYHSGHIGTAVISGDPSYHHIYFNEERTTTLMAQYKTAELFPVLMVDTDTNEITR